MTAFNELKGSFTFTNARFTSKKNSNTVNFNKYTVKGFARCKYVGKNTNDSLGKFRRTKIRLKNRNTRGFSKRKNCLRRLKVLAENYARNFISKEFFDRIKIFLAFKFLPLHIYIKIPPCAIQKITQKFCYFFGQISSRLCVIYCGLLLQCLRTRSLKSGKKRLFHAECIQYIVVGGGKVHRILWFGLGFMSRIG